MNPYESGTRKVILATLVYIRAEGRVLMVHRNAPDRPGDYHAGKWNGLGGKLEPGESPFQGAQREVREESGLEIPQSAFRSLGVIHFPDFKAHKSEDWTCFVFEVQAPASTLTRKLEATEGELHWIPDTDVMKLNLWKGDSLFLPQILAGKPVLGTIWYRGQDVERHEIVPIL